MALNYAAPGYVEMNQLAAYRRVFKHESVQCVRLWSVEGVIHGEIIKLMEPDAARYIYRKHTSRVFRLIARRNHKCKPVQDSINSACKSWAIVSALAPYFINKRNLPDGSNTKLPAV